MNHSTPFVQEEATRFVPSADNILRIALDVAEGTLKCGGSISRVEETVTRICQAYGAIHVESFAIVSMFAASTFTDVTSSEICFTAPSSSVIRWFWRVFSSSTRFSNSL